MAEGIFALLGVLVGGLIAAGTTYWMDRKREDRKVQAAARRAFMDLYAIEFSLDAALAAGVLDPREIERRLEHYLEHEPTFAVHLRIRDYLVVWGVVEQLRSFVQDAQNQACSELTKCEPARLETLRDETVSAGDILLDVARRGPAHMWAQRVSRKLRPKQDTRAIRKKIHAITRKPTGTQPDLGDHDGPTP